MNSMRAIALVAISFAGCSYRDAGAAGFTPAEAQLELKSSSEDAEHRLYAAALASSESPLDTELFSDVCRQIGIHDASGKSTAKYMHFVQAHVEWGTRAENQPFRKEIDSMEKARDYIKAHLSAEFIR